MAAGPKEFAVFLAHAPRESVLKQMNSLIVLAEHFKKHNNPAFANALKNFEKKK